MAGQIYIPLCFYFIGSPENPNKELLRIYIPLCFYFIPHCAAPVYGWIPHLHSTMLLLYLLCNCKYDLRIIDLHSTMLLLYLILHAPFRAVWLIYIPLCFYFILPGTVISSTLSSFTFHYASTLSNNVHVLIGSFGKFTFHYASTLSDCSDLERGTKVSDLHSTMLLLYPGYCLQPAWWSSFTFHYASTLSRTTLSGAPWNPAFTFHYASTLSRDTGTSYQAEAAFTFHYASTLSQIDYASGRGNRDLHSTMLLLYRVEIHLYRISSCIYIPLCFYFIPFAVCMIKRLVSNLHSTMLLLYPVISAEVMRYMRNDLHSTMLLLYLISTKLIASVLYIYIPLCFYFIPRPPFPLLFSSIQIYFLSTPLSS